MTHSLNEIEAMAKRAARGGGLSWGLAEEAAKATRWLGSFGLPATTLLADMLDLGDGRDLTGMAPRRLDGVWTAPAGDLNPLIAGPSLADSAARLADDGRIDMADIACPLLIVPSAGWAARLLGVPVAVAWDSVEVTTDGTGLAVHDPDGQLLAARSTRLACTAPAAPGEVRQPGLRGTPDPESWTRLGRYAHRTYAPATEESRLLGAGAGLNDND